MNDASLMGMRDGVADALEHFQPSNLVVRPGRPVGQKGGQGPAFDERHGEVAAAVRERSGLEDGDDSRVMELRNDASLVGEPSAGFGIGERCSARGA